MAGLLIAEKDVQARKRMVELFIEAGYDITVTSSAACVLYGILKKTAQVLLLSSEFDDLTAADLIPVLKKCDRNLSIILVSDRDSLPVIRKIRKEGIFYHALKPGSFEESEELRQAVQCAFNRSPPARADPPNPQKGRCA